MIEFNKRNIRTWSMLGSCGAFGMAAEACANDDNDFAVVTADLCFFSGLERLRKSQPEKIYNVGIAEQNMIGMAGGMAKEGMNVFATTYASFASARALDQVKMIMGYMKLPVKLVGLTAGCSSGILGATHMAIEDIAIMRAIPNIVILSPADCTETVKCVLAAAKCSQPVYLRLTGAQRTPIVYSEDYDFEIGKAIVLRQGTDISIFATGTMVSESLKAADRLEREGISCSVIDVHTIKPLDVETIKKFSNCKLIVTAEEHSIIGGLGSAVAECLCDVENKPRQIMIGFHDAYPAAANYDYLLKKSGLTEEEMTIGIKKVLRNYCE